MTRRKKDKYGWNKGNYYDTKIHAFGDKFKLEVGSTHTGEFLFKKTYNKKKDALDASESYLKFRR